MSDTVLLDLDARGVATITINRPDKRNAFDDELVVRLHEAFESVDRDPAVRIVVLTGSGTVFSAGADLGHMKRQGSMTEAENYQDALRFARCLQTLDALGKPVIARVNGGAYGGGIGLIACADIAVGVETAKFALTEVRFGIVPAVISPFVVNAIGARQARRLFLNAQPFEAPTALAIGLLHEVAAPAMLDVTIEANVALLLQGGPAAQRAAKRLVREVGQLDRETRAHHTAQLLAELRASPEGKEGLGAFLENRKPGWTPTDSR